MISTNEQLFRLVKNAPQDIQHRLGRKTVQQGDELISQGESPDKVYIMRDGLVKITKLEANGKEFSFGFLGKGELIGEIEVFLEQPFACRVTTLKDTSVYRLSKHLFLEWIERDRELNRLILKDMAFRLYTLSTRTSFQMLYPVEYVIMKILYISQKDNVEITKTDLADYLGITIRSMNRTLNRLKEKGILLFAENRLSIRSQEKLKQELMRYEYS